MSPFGAFGSEDRRRHSSRGDREAFGSGAFLNADEIKIGHLRVKAKHGLASE